MGAGPNPIILPALWWTQRSKPSPPRPHWSSGERGLSAPPPSGLSVSSCCGHPRSMAVGLGGEPGPGTLQTPAEPLPLQAQGTSSLLCRLDLPKLTRVLPPGLKACTEVCWGICSWALHSDLSSGYTPPHSPPYNGAGVRGRLSWRESWEGGGKEWGEEIAGIAVGAA